MPKIRDYNKEKFDWRKQEFIMIEDRKLFLALRKEFSRWPNVCQYDEGGYEVYFYKPSPSLFSQIKLLVRREEMTGSYFEDGPKLD